MKKISKSILIATVCVLVGISCSDSHKEAKAYLQNIHNLYDAGEYDAAKLKIDSLKVLYPKAFDEIKESLVLLQDVRKALDAKQIAFSDSALNILGHKIDSVKQLFTLEQNKEYESAGRYIPKGTSSAPTSTILRSGVNSDGSLYIESVYIGGQYHNQVRVSSKDGSFVETLPVVEDGLNFRFNNLGRQYEIIKFAKDDENGVAKFIYANADKPLTVTLKGKNTTSYTLSQSAKKNIANSLQLSTLMLEADSLLNVKEIALKKIEYIEAKKNNTLKPMPTK